LVVNQFKTCWQFDVICWELFHLNVCQQSQDFILRLHQSGLKIQIVIQSKYPPPLSKESRVLFEHYASTWTRNRYRKHNSKLQYKLSVPEPTKQSYYGKAKRTEGRRRAIRDSLRSLWFSSTLPSELLDDLFVTQAVGIELV